MLLGVTLITMCSTRWVEGQFLSCPKHIFMDGITKSRCVQLKSLKNNNNSKSSSSSSLYRRFERINFKVFLCMSYTEHQYVSILCFMAMEAPREAPTVPPVMCCTENRFSSSVSNAHFVRLCSHKNLIQHPINIAWESAINFWVWLKATNEQPRNSSTEGWKNWTISHNWIAGRFGRKRAKA